VRCKALERKEVTIDSFHLMRTLGRGAFGCVSAVKKKDTGRLYAMKQIDKRRVQATKSVGALLAEKRFLEQMDSLFVTSLKFSFMDADKLYLVMDLMTGGDLKYHLNHDDAFGEARARFYAAQILLGLEHIHEQHIIYRDLKLENVLVGENGHVKISDLGLAVSIDDGPVKGYAGTPGYTAPEVVLSQVYGREADFFSLGVVIYRALCGKKPFAKRRARARTGPQRGASVELDHNVVRMTPRYEPRKKFNVMTRSLCRGLLQKKAKWRLGAGGCDEVKAHPWFDCIDWAMLEAGYLDAPHQPGCDEINAEQQQNIGPPTDDAKYERVKLMPDFDEKLTGFAFKSTKMIQSELVDVLEKVQQMRRDELKQKGKKNGERHCAEQIYCFPSPQEYQSSLEQDCSCCKSGKCVII